MCAPPSLRTKLPPTIPKTHYLINSYIPSVNVKTIFLTFLVVLHKFQASIIKIAQMNNHSYATAGTDESNYQPGISSNDNLSGTLCRANYYRTSLFSVFVLMLLSFLRFPQPSLLCLLFGFCSGC